MGDGTLIALVSVVTVIFFVIGVPIFLVIGLWVVGVSLVIDFTLANLGVTLFEGLNFFGLLALPLFILTGDLINAAGIAKRLADFAYSALGWIRGGLAMSTIGACGLFAAISGSNSATTATIGSIMHPEMVKGGYPPRFAAATAAAGGTVGIISSAQHHLHRLRIPDEPVDQRPVHRRLVPRDPDGRADDAGGLPRRQDHRLGAPHQIRAEARRQTGLRAYLGFVAILIVVDGVYSGAFSPTEAAGVTVGFCLLAGLFVTRELKWKSLPAVILRSGTLTGMLAPMVAVSIVMQQVLSLLGAKEFFTDLVNSLGGGYYTAIFASMAIVLVAGCILESLPDTVIFAPILAPIAVAAGVDPFDFAVIFLIGDAIGFITPPYGLNLYVASAVTQIPYLQLVKPVMPYFIALTIAWIIVALWPALSIGLIRH